MSDTPIFDQLARERGYNRMVASGPTLRFRAAVVHPNPQVVADQIEGLGLHIAGTTGQTDDTVNADPTEEEDIIVFRKPIPVTTLADLAKGTHQE